MYLPENVPGLGRWEMETKNIKQSVTIKASPHDVYEALMDSKKHSQFTGGKAMISRKVGEKFSAFDGYSEGTNLELVPDKKIVQSWRASDWPEGHYSTATFSLKEFDGGTHLNFTQTGVPDEQCPDISQGWRDYYWTPMKAMLEKHT
jgi:activator of HSP90 ATPase